MNCQESVGKHWDCACGTWEVPTDRRKNERRRTTKKSTCTKPRKSLNLLPLSCLTLQARAWNETRGSRAYLCVKSCSHTLAGFLLYARGRRIKREYAEETTRTIPMYKVLCNDITVVYCRLVNYFTSRWWAAYFCSRTALRHSLCSTRTPSLGGCIFCTKFYTIRISVCFNSFLWMNCKVCICTVYNIVMFWCFCWFARDWTQSWSSCCIHSLYT